MMNYKMSDLRNGNRVLKIVNQDEIAPDGRDSWEEWFGRLADKHETLQSKLDKYEKALHKIKIMGLEVDPSIESTVERFFDCLKISTEALGEK